MESMAKGLILQKILETLEEGALNQLDFFKAVLISGYGASINKIDYEYNKNKKIRANKKFQSEELEEKRQKLQKFLWKLKHDGLVVETKGENPKFSISSEGKIKLAKLKKKLPAGQYKKEIHNSPVIISFDIPEKLRRKRGWFREVIKNLGFKMIHQSVWVGNIKVPQELIIDLNRTNIIEFIEIFEISKAGSLRKIS